MQIRITSFISAQNHKKSPTKMVGMRFNQLAHTLYLYLSGFLGLQFAKH